MRRTIICPNCQLAQPVEESEDQEPAEVSCGNCGQPLQVKPKAASRPATILCIDDDRIALGFLADTLKRAGYRTLITVDGPTGIEIAKREQPDVILLDVIMPTMHGLEVCQQLRADPQLKDTPIILLTALEDAGVGAMGSKVGATATLHKPFRLENIVSVIKQVLGRESISPGL